MPSTALTTSSLRKLISKILVADSDFDAFVIDHFPSIKRRFAVGMDRVTKENILLEHGDSSLISNKLHEAYPNEIKAHSQVNSHSSSGPVACVSVSSSAFLQPKDDELMPDSDPIRQYLSNELNEALRSFSSQPLIWVDPILSKTNGISRTMDNKTEQLITISDILSNQKSYIIKAPPQFGLTCLARYLAKQAWIVSSKIWLYIDCQEIKSADRVEQKVRQELCKIGPAITDIQGIIIDSWTNHEKGSYKILKKISDIFSKIPVIVMQTIDDGKFLTESNAENIGRSFDAIHLLALPRDRIRMVVSAYNDQMHIADDDVVITKLVTDLEALNMHRTPLNCLTLLKVSEKYFDESPVNRNEMIKMLLFLLFNTDAIPTYKARPDLKDCEYVLGRFCETMIRENSNLFSRENFLHVLKSYCAERVIDLEVDIVFDVLHANNIIVKRDGMYGFRFRYWIYYFAAQRMQQDQAFATYIFDDKRYTSYPEIVEFYTGIDRSREDALKVLLRDLGEVASTVHGKVGMPDDMNPYKEIQWMLTDDDITKLQIFVGEEVLQSKLPDTVKDQYADRQYDRISPYNQSIQQILQEYSLLCLIQTIKAASRALRNSDYVDPEVKRDLLKAIVSSWEQVAKVLFALWPILAVRGQAIFEGFGFFLDDSFASQNLQERLAAVFQSIPYNIVSMFRHDLFSHKMGPLLFDRLSKEKNELRRHELVLVLIFERPRDWKKRVQDYIVMIPKNSFYLFDVYNSLYMQYRFGFASSATLAEISYLLKMVIAKHDLGHPNPGPDKVIKIPNKILPKRELDND